MYFRSKKELAHWALGPQHLCLFFDYDSMLANATTSPYYSEVINLFFEFADNPTMRMAMLMLSRQNLTDIRCLIPVSGLFWAGNYGTEVRTPSGEIIQRIYYEEIRPLLDTVLIRWQAIIHGQIGFDIEDKVWTLVLHARRVSDKTAQQIFAMTHRALHGIEMRNRFRILDDPKSLQIAPFLTSKRETVSYLLGQYPYSDGRILYIGNEDREKVFLPADANHGITIKVSDFSEKSLPREVQFCFKTPLNLLQWLEDLSEISA